MNAYYRSVTLSSSQICALATIFPALLVRLLSDEGESSLDMFSLEMFENIAYVMAKHADNNIPDNPEDWLDEFSTFSIYQVLPELIKLWGLNVQTQVESKKTSTE